MKRILIMMFLLAFFAPAGIAGNMPVEDNVFVEVVAGGVYDPIEQAYCSESYESDSSSHFGTAVDTFVQIKTDEQQSSKMETKNCIYFHQPGIGWRRVCI